MKFAFVVVVGAVVLATIAHSSPIVEDDWSDQDDLLQQMYEDVEQTPVSQLSQASPETIADAKAKGDAAGSAAAEAAAEENKWSAQEADFAKKAQALNKEERALQQKAAADNAAAATKAANDRLASLAKGAEAVKMTEQAEAKNAILQKKYNDTINAMHSETAAAKAKSAADLKKYKAEMKTLNETITAEKHAGVAIQEAMKKEAADLKKQQGDIEAAFAAKKASLKAKSKAEEEKLQTEEKAAQAKFASQFKSNADRALAAQAAIAAEKAQNDKDAAAAKAAIDAKYAAIAKAHGAAEVQYQKKKKAEADALAASREGTKKKFEAQAKADQLAYKKAMGSAHRLKIAADHAQTKWEDAMKASEAEQAKIDKAEEAQDKSDAEMAECATDGSECQDKDGKCQKTDDKKGPYMADDLVSCTDTKPTEQAYGGEKWAGTDPPLPKTELKPESQKCKDMHAKLEKAFPAAFGNGTEPLTGIACMKDVDPAAHKQALLDFFDMAEECPPYCVPGTATSDGLVADTNGICIDSDDYMGFKAQITDLPVYHAFGTNNRFAGGDVDAELCSMAHNFIEGFGAGAAPDPTPAPTPNVTVAPPPPPPLATGPWALNKNAGIPAGSGSGAAPAAEAAGSAEVEPLVDPLELIEDPGTIAHAKAIKEANDKHAAEAAAAEKKWTGEEAKYTDQAAALNKKERHLADQAATDNAKAEADAQNAMVQATDKIAATMKQTAAAEKKFEALDAKYKKVQADMKAQQGAADKDEAAKAATYKTEMDKLKGEIEKEQANGEAIQKDQVAQTKALKAKQAQIAADFKKKSDALAAEDAKNKGALADEEKKAQAEFAAKFKSNAARAAAEKAAIAEEKKENDEAADAEQKKINSRYAAVKAAHDKEESLYIKKTAEEAAQLKASREATKAKFAAKAAADEADYQKAKAHADVLKGKADHAHQVWENNMDASAAEQAKLDKMAEEADAHDAEDTECAIDGSQCRTAEGGCAAITPKGPYMADDLVSCTDTKPEEQAYSGEAWAGVPPPLKRTPLPKPTAKCTAMKAAFSKGPYADALGGKDCPLKAIACRTGDGQAFYAAKKKAFLDFFAFMGECPPWCFPGSETNDGLTQDTNGICITGADFAMFGEQIKDMPIYKAMGTNGRFAAGAPADLCRMANNFIDGLTGGAFGSK